ncbi:hypothetical protein [Leifsonia poae]|uniref:hypothetical protein n=1 Tax=Leifsonia poae TaxID=110933 RepID=UPI001CC0B660|nr:hypothetical protein [Leifsonia poae]
MKEESGRKRRRAQLPAVPGSDPTPQARPAGRADAPTRAAEDTDAAWGDRPGDSNDDRLRQDVPPHW